MNKFALMLKQFYPLCLLFFISLYSCDSLKKVQDDPSARDNREELDEIQGKRVFNPETGAYEIVRDVTGDLDTIRWKEPAVEVVPPITSEATIRLEGNNGEETSQLLSSYNVVLALPFLADQYDEVEQKIDRRSIPALNFYEGAKMAFDVLSSEGVNLEIGVVDTRASQASTTILTNNPDLQNAHLIVGSFRNNTARVLSDFALENKKTFISPFYPHQSFAVDNPYFIQINPSEKTHCSAIMRHVKARFPANRIVVFGRNTVQEQKLMNYFLDAHYEMEGSTSADSIRMITIDDESSSLEETDLLPFMDDISTTAFIVASSSQTFAYAMLRKIDLDKEDRSIVVYGQPRWKDFTQIGYQYFETMNVHVSSESYLNPDSYEVQSFRDEFYNKYGMPPTSTAYKGYDIMLYFGRLLKEYGTGFKNIIDQKPADGLHTRFDFQRVVNIPREPTEGEGLDYFDQYMNKHLNILEFSGFQFRKAD